MEERQEVWPEAGKEFYAHLLAQERSTGPVVDPRERGLCLQWIVRACKDYGFRPGAGGLAATLFDAFVSAARTQKGCSIREATFKEVMVRVAGHLLDMNVHKESALCELICIVCISIAAKKVEPKEHAPYLGDFDENFTLGELKRTEALVLGQLRWHISYSTPYDSVHYWASRLPCGVEKSKFIELCEEAIGVCLPELSFNERRATVFGAGVTLWALAAMSQEAHLPEWAKLLETHLTFAMEQAFAVQEDVGNHLQDAYPHAYRPCRADSPPSILEGMPFREGIPQGLKRPVAARWARPVAASWEGEGKKPKMET